MYDDDVKSGDLHILHLEDNPTDSELVALVLVSQKISCKLDVVRNREEYEAALARGGFQLILSDYAVPSFDGMAALHLARAAYPDIPFIFVTGALGEERAIETLKSGATDYILKDRLTQLGRSVSRAMEEAENREQRKRAEDILRRSENLVRSQNSALMALTRSGMSRSADFQQMLGTITEVAARTIEVERVSIWSYNDERTVIQCLDLFELSQASHRQGDQLAASQYPAYFAALESERTISASDALHDLRTIDFAESYLKPLRIAAMLDAPVRLGGRVVGVVCFEHVGSERAWLAEEENFAGSIADLVSLVMEMRERESAEHALRESQAQLAGIIGSAMDAIITVDADRKVLMFNAAAERMFRCTSESALGQSIDRFTPNGFRDGIQNPESKPGGVRLHRRSIGSMGAIYGRRADGEEFPIEASISQVEMKGRHLYTVILRDITERKRAEHEINVRAEQQAAITELGHFALMGVEIKELMDRAVTLVSRTLHTPFAFIEEVSPAKGSITVVAGIGWKPGSAELIMPMEPPSESAYAFQNSHPTVIENLNHETRFTPSELLKSHGVSSGVLVLISGSTEPFGVFGVFSAEPRSFTRDDINFIQAIVNILVTGIERKRVEAAIQSQKAILEAQGEALVDGICVVSEDGRVLYSNRRFREMWGLVDAEKNDLSEEYLFNRTAQMTMDRQGYEARLAYIREHPELNTWDEIQLSDGRIFDRYCAPVYGTDNTCYGRVYYTRDITERRRFEKEREQLLSKERVARSALEVAHRRAIFLAKAGMVLGSSLDYSKTFSSVARLAVTSIADWCVVELIKEDGSLERVALAHANLSRVQIARKVEPSYRHDMNSRVGVANVLRTGASELYTEIPDELLATIAGTKEQLRNLRSMRLTSIMIVPLTARGKTLGAITFISAESRRSYTREDLAMAEELALRVANAVDNARLYRQTQDALRSRDEALRYLAMIADQQAAVATLGQQALNNVSTFLLFKDAVQLLQKAFRVSHTVVFLTTPDETAMKLACHTGFDDVPELILGTEKDRMAGYLLGSDSVVVMENIRTENRFTVPDFLRDRGISSGLGLAIRGMERTFGILGIFDRESRSFTPDDIYFLQSVANILATTLERRESEDALQQSETRYRLVTLATNDAIWDWNLATNQVTWNDGLSKLFGHSPEDISTFSEWWQEHIAPDDRERVMKNLIATMNAGGNIWNDTYAFRRKDGEYAIVMNRAYVVQDKQGVAVRMIGAMTDITERKRAEESLRKAHDDLERRVIERTEELSHANRILMSEIARRKQTEDRLKKYTGALERAQEASRNMMEDLESEVRDRKQAEQALRILSKHLVNAQENERRRLARELHDGINQLLSSVKMRVQAAEEKTVGFDERIRKDIIQAKVLLNQSIQEIREISKNLSPSVLEDLGLVTALRSICNEVKEQTKIAITFKCGEIPARLTSEMELAIYRIVQESLNNIVKHSGATTTLIDMSVKNSSIHLRIADNGTGFESEQDGEKRSRKGFGLISMSERAAYVGGTFKVNSIPSGGTEITLEIPFSSAYQERTLVHEKTE